MTLSEKLSQNKLIALGFNGNSWLWVHILGGIVVAQIQYLRGESFLVAMVTVLIAAIAWELIEVIFGARKGLHILGIMPVYESRGRESYFDAFNVFSIDTYGSLERWFYDSLGDIIGALIAAALSSLFLLGA